MADIDNLSIKIAASTGTAVKNVNNLASALQGLSTALNSVDPSRLNSAAQAANSMSSAVASMQASSRAMQSIATSMANIGQQSGSIRQTTDAAQGLASSIGQAAQNAGGASSAMQSVASAGSECASSVGRLADESNRVSTNTASSARNLRTFAKSSKTASFHAKGLFKELTRVSKMLKLMITRMVLRKVIQGVLDGFKNLAQYSNTFNATLSLLWNDFRQLGNSIAAAVSPLLNALAPAIHYIIQLLIQAIDVINQFVSALLGLSSFTRAKTLTDDYAKSLDKSNKSAKALKKTVLGFDELNQLHDNSSSGGGGTSPANMFEELPINPKILKFIDDMKNAIKGLKKYWDEFMKGFKKGLGNDWRDKVAMIVDGAKRIGKALADILNDSEVVAARERFYMNFSRMLGALAGTAVRVGLNIGANLAQGIANSLEQKAPELKKFLVDVMDVGSSISNQIEEFAYAIGNISDVLVGGNAIELTTQLSNIFLEAYMLIEESAAHTGEAIVELLTKPIIDNQDSIKEALDNAFGNAANFAKVLDEALKDIREVCKETWEQYLKPTIDNITQAISDVVAVVVENWNKYISPIFDKLANDFGEIWRQDLKPIFSDLMTIIGAVGELISWLLKTVIKPLLTYLTNVFSPVARASIEVLLNSVKSAVKFVSLAIGSVMDVLASLIRFLHTGFTQGWHEAWQGLLSDFNKIADGIADKAKSVLNTIIDSINSLMRGAITMGDNVVNMLNKIPGVSIPTVGSKVPQIPRLATGGIVEDGLFMANHNELIGGFANGKTAVANNEQITQGIAQAVFNAMMSANANGGGERYINNTIYIDDVAVARAVTKGQDKLNRRYSPTMA